MGDFSLYRVALNAKEICQSVVVEVWQNKRDKLVDYRQVDGKHAIIMYTKVLNVVDYIQHKKIQTYKVAQP